MGREDQPGVLPSFSGEESFFCLAFPQCMERIYCHLRKGERAA
jgi:hypothetical protein